MSQPINAGNLRKAAFDRETVIIAGGEFGPSELMATADAMEQNQALQVALGLVTVALRTMVDRAKETYPHFEGEKGQRDIAQAERAISAVSQVRREKLPALSKEERASRRPIAPAILANAKHEKCHKD